MTFLSQRKSHKSVPFDKTPKAQRTWTTSDMNSLQEAANHFLNRLREFNVNFRPKSPIKRDRLKGLEDVLCRAKSFSVFPIVC